MCKYCKCINCDRPYDENPDYYDDWSVDEKHYTFTDSTWVCSEDCLDKWLRYHLVQDSCQTCNKTIYRDTNGHEQAIVNYAKEYELSLAFSKRYSDERQWWMYYCDYDCECADRYNEEIFYCTIPRCGKKFCAKKCPIKGVCYREDCQRSLEKAQKKHRQWQMKRRLEYEKVMRSNNVPDAAVTLIRAFIS